MPSTQICIVMLSTEYMSSQKCRTELHAAAKEDKKIIPLVFGKLPRNLADNKWFGSSEADMLAGILIRQRLTNLIPAPSEGFYMDKWERGTASLLNRIQAILSGDPPRVSISRNSSSDPRPKFDV